jgi:hypothetical protein
MTCILTRTKLLLAGIAALFLATSAQAQMFGPAPPCFPGPCIHESNPVVHAALERCMRFPAGNIRLNCIRQAVLTLRKARR